MVQGMNSILSAGQRSQLLAIQRTQRSADSAQLDLATGKTVRRAVHNPQNYFTAESLNGKSQNLNRLLDTITQGAHTVELADKAIDSISSLLERAEDTLRELEDLYISSDSAAVSVVPDDINEVIEYDVAAGQDSEPLQGSSSLINDNTGLSLNGNLWKRFAVNYTVTQDTVLKLEYQSTSEPEIASIGLETNDTYTDDNTRFHLYGTQSPTTSSQIGNLRFAADIGTYSYTGAGSVQEISIPIGQYFTGEYSHMAFINDDDAPPHSGNSIFQSILLFEDTLILDPEKTDEANNLIAQYEKITEQITALANESSFMGVNLLKQGNLKLPLNEKQNNYLQLEGIDATAEGLNLEGLNLRRFKELQATQSSLTKARDTLRDFNTSIATQNTIINTREQFIERSISILNSARDNLVISDLNETGANLLTLQARQQIQVNILSLAQPSVANLLGQR